MPQKAFATPVGKEALIATNPGRSATQDVREEEPRGTDNKAEFRNEGCGNERLLFKSEILNKTLGRITDMKGAGPEAAVWKITTC